MLSGTSVWGYLPFSLLGVWMLWDNLADVAEVSWKSEWPSPFLLPIGLSPSPSTPDLTATTAGSLGLGSFAGLQGHTGLGAPIPPTPLSAPTRDCSLSQDPSPYELYTFPPVLYPNPFSSHKEGFVGTRIPQPQHCTVNPRIT